jgi:hypothetical protein
VCGDFAVLKSVCYEDSERSLVSACDGGRVSLLTELRSSLVFSSGRSNAFRRVRIDIQKVLAG